MERILVEVRTVDQMGAEVMSMEEGKPINNIGLGGWKRDGDYYWTRIKGADAKRFKAGSYPTIVAENDRIISVE